MSLYEILAEIPKLSFANRQELVRGAMAVAEDELSPEESAILGRRLEDFQRDPDAGISVDELKTSVLKRIKKQ